MNTSEKILVMQAWMEGKEIEYKTRNEPDFATLINSGEPCWNWELFEYRIAPPRPMEIQVWVKEGSDPIQWLLINDSSGLATPDDAMKLNGYTLKTFVEKV